MLGVCLKFSSKMVNPKLAYVVLIKLSQIISTLNISVYIIVYVSIHCYIRK